VIGVNTTVRVEALSPAWAPFTEELRNGLAEWLVAVIDDFEALIPVAAHAPRLDQACTHLWRLRSGADPFFL